MSISWCVLGGVSMDVSLVLTLMSGLGRVALHGDGGVLHHRSSWELENTAIYEGCPLYHPPYIHRLFNRRSDRGICCCVRHSQIYFRVVLQGSSSLRTWLPRRYGRPAQYRLGGTVTNIGVADYVTDYDGLMASHLRDTVYIGIPLHSGWGCNLCCGGW